MSRLMAPPTTKGLCAFSPTLMIWIGGISSSQAVDGAAACDAGAARTCAGRSCLALIVRRPVMRYPLPAFLITLVFLTAVRQYKRQPSLTLHSNIQKMAPHARTIHSTSARNRA
jgi:hypothetical protein